MIEDIQEGNYESINSSPRRTKSRFKPIKREVSSSLDMSTTIQLTECEKQCRICLDTGSNDDNQLVAPCKCTGTVKYVHDKCFRQWIEKQYSQKSKKEQASFLKEGVQCELCKVRMSLLFTYKHICCQTNKFTTQVQQRPLTFILFLVFFVLNFGCLAFLSINTVKTSLDFRKQYITSMITIIAFVFLGFTALITMYYFAIDYLVQRIMILEGYEQKKRQTLRYSRNQVIPQNFEE